MLKGKDTARGWGFTEGKPTNHNEASAISVGGVHTGQAAESVEYIGHAAQLARALGLYSTFQGDAGFV